MSSTLSDHNIVIMPLQSPVSQSRSGDLSIHAARFLLYHYFDINDIDKKTVEHFDIIDRETLIKVISDNAHSKQYLTVWSANSSEDFTALGLWDLIQSNEWSIVQQKNRKDKTGPTYQSETRPKMMLSGSKSYIYIKIGNKKVRFLSTRNYINQRPQDLQQLIDSENQHHETERILRNEVWKYRPHEMLTLVEICKSILRIMSDNCGGSMSGTAANIGWSDMIRSNKRLPFAPHENIDATRLERRACFGPRFTLFSRQIYGDNLDEMYRIRNMKNTNYYPQNLGSVYEIDIKSCYPTIMARHRVPIALIEHMTSPSIDDLTKLMPHYGFVASCRIKTDVDKYPYDNGTHTIYPIGEFDTVLCGPELEYAISNGHVKFIHTANKYAMGYAYKDTAKKWMEARKYYDEIGDMIGVLFCKSIINCTVGKAAEKRNKYTPIVVDNPPTQWGEWYRCNGITGEVERIQSQCGHHYLIRESDSDPGVFPAAFAFLSSYGRSYLSILQSSLDRYRLIALRADSAVVYDDTRDTTIIRDILCQLNPSFRTAFSHISYCRYWTPNHYYADGKFILSGFGDSHADIDKGIITTKQTINPANGPCRDTPSYIDRIVRSYGLSNIRSSDSYTNEGLRIIPQVHQPYLPEITDSRLTIDSENGLS